MSVSAIDLATFAYSPKNNLIGGGSGEALWLLGSTKNVGGGNYTFLGDSNDTSQTYGGGPYRVGILFIESELNLSGGNQTLTGTASTGLNSVTNVYGIDFEYSELNISGSSKGGTKITGSALSSAASNTFVGGISVQLDSEINITGQNAYIRGEASANQVGQLAWGIMLNGGGSSISTGTGNDTIVGIANIGSGNAFGIGRIDGVGASISTGDGNDKVIAQATVGGQIVNGFYGGIHIDLGAGNDTISGFGNATVEGGSGTDTLDLSQYALAMFTITKDALSQEVAISKSGTTMHLAHFESFVFSDGTFSFAALPATTFG
jgi:hypothetical protein